MGTPQDKKLLKAHQFTEADVTAIIKRAQERASSNIESLSSTTLSFDELLGVTAELGIAPAAIEASAKEHLLKAKEEEELRRKKQLEKRDRLWKVEAYLKYTWGPFWIIGGALFATVGTVGREHGGLGLNLWVCIFGGAVIGAALHKILGID